jgi:hypothetical protein
MESEKIQEAWKDLEKMQKISSIWASYLKPFGNGSLLKSRHQKLSIASHKLEILFTGSLATSKKWEKNPSHYAVFFAQMVDILYYLYLNWHNSAHCVVRRHLTEEQMTLLEQTYHLLSHISAKHRVPPEFSFRYRFDHRELLCRRLQVNSTIRGQC